MLRIRQILVSAGTLAVVTVILTACGQKGALFIPTEPAAANRATLPQTLRLGTPPPAASALPPAVPASTPRTP
ncbi:MAG: lipoprotein [Burkholderiaceae bacterium]